MDIRSNRWIQIAKRVSGVKSFDKDCSFEKPDKAVCMTLQNQQEAIAELASTTSNKGQKFPINHPQHIDIIDILQHKSI